MPAKPQKTNNAALLLRIGLAFVFLYAAISSLRQPLVWAAYLPDFLTSSISATLLIEIFAVYELGLAAWLITGQGIRYAALLSALTIAGIVVADPGQLMTTFRDVGLVFMAAALFLLEK